MSNTANCEPINIELSVPASLEESFDLFVMNFTFWYPKAYTWSQQKLDIIQIEPSEGGRCFERGPNNFELDWGRVLEYDPPTHLLFTWQINYNRQPVPDSGGASEVEINFTSSDKKGYTYIQLIHRNFENHEEGQKYRDALASPEGWPFTLKCYKTYVSKKLM